MSFFDHQDRARRSTTRLVVLFGLAVLAIIASVELLLALVMGYLGRDPRTGALDLSGATDPQLLIVAVFGTLAIVGGGSLYKVAQLRAGGHVVAEELGGQLLAPDSQDPVHRRLLNVVEEMAIASGVPTPPVYLMAHEDGINAFAAGFTPEDAVIGVTRGTATRLSRDELQGVIAHEFSHILNGDMRLNIRLMGVLHGILVIGMIGYFLLRTSFYTGGRRSRDNNGLPILALGAGLSVIGFAGTFFGNLIKAAVSRQREFLADASAVQFTRQREGIVGALKKIGGFAAGSSIRHPNAPEASHMFFGRATSGFNAMFSTHPPLAERIRRLDPQWDGEFADSSPRAADPATQPAGAVGFAAGGAAADTATATPARALTDAVAHVGQPDETHLQHAAELIASLPAPLVAASREAYGSRAVVYALLLDRDDAEVRQAQLSSLDRTADAGVLVATLKLSPHVERLNARLRLPLLDLALPALRLLTAGQYATFESNVAALVGADRRLDLFEWVIQRVLLRDLGSVFGGRQPARPRHRSLDAVRPAITQLLSVLAWVGQRDAEGARRAFESGRDAMAAPGLALLPQDACSLEALDRALIQLDEAFPQLKRRVLEGAAACIAADDRVTATEAEVLRAIAASMSCPMPPIRLD